MGESSEPRGARPKVRCDRRVQPPEPEPDEASHMGCGTADANPSVTLTKHELLQHSVDDEKGTEEGTSATTTAFWQQDAAHLQAARKVWVVVAG